MSKGKITIVAGPTAVGKTEYAINLARENDGEIVSLDSVQVYKELDIGSAKPSQVELDEIKHYMIDEVDPNIDINVKMFKDMATEYIDNIISRGKLPILVGGSGFYINAVLFDTDFLYEDEIERVKVREEIDNMCNGRGIDYLYQELMKVDRESCETIPKGNVKRLKRAYEFYRLHNMPISLHNKNERMKESKYDYKYYVLNMDRERLYSRINDRVDKMIEQGLLREIKQLINKGYSKSLNSMNSIGYKELYDFCKMRDEISDIHQLDSDSKKELNEIIEEIKQHSRNYAKRQLTWFRTQRNVTWIMK